MFDDDVDDDNKDGDYGGSGDDNDGAGQNGSRRRLFPRSPIAAPRPAVHAPSCRVKRPVVHCTRTRFICARAGDGTPQLSELSVYGELAGGSTVEFKTTITATAVIRPISKATLLFTRTYLSYICALSTSFRRVANANKNIFIKPTRCKKIYNSIYGRVVHSDLLCNRKPKKKKKTERVKITKNVPFHPLLNCKTFLIHVDHVKMVLDKNSRYITSLG